jgi:hypothetical protein
LLIAHHRGSCQIERLKIVLVERFLHQLVLCGDCRIDQKKISSFVFTGGSAQRAKSGTWAVAA